jgi:hypothetical protein
MTTYYAQFKQAYDSLLEFVQKSADYRKRFIKKWYSSALDREVVEAPLALLSEAEAIAMKLLEIARKIAAVHLPNSPKIPNEFRGKLLDGNTMRMMSIPDMLQIFSYCEQKIECRIEHLKFRMEGNPHQKKWLEPEVILLESYGIIANSLVHRLLDELDKLKSEEEVLQRDMEVLKTMEAYVQKIHGGATK